MYLKYLVSPETVRREEPERKSTFQIGAATEGRNQFENEDCHLTIPKKMVGGVFDGVGGNGLGNFASHNVKEFMIAKFSKLPSTGVNIETVKSLLEDSLQSVSNILFKDSRFGVNTRGITRGARTTASMAIVCPDTKDQGVYKDTVVVGNVGDSRVYIFRAEAVNLEQVTLDDGLVRAQNWDLEKQKNKQEKAGKANDPSEINSIFDRANRNRITQAVGDGKINVNLYTPTLNLDNGDKVIITSDGIHDNLTDMEIAEVIAVSPSAQIAAERLVARAEERGLEANHPRHKVDDMTVVVMGKYKAAA